VLFEHAAQGAIAAAGVVALERLAALFAEVREKDGFRV
jgi:hypothetical protein